MLSSIIWFSYCNEDGEGVLNTLDSNNLTINLIYWLIRVIFHSFAWKEGIIHKAIAGPIPRHAITQNLPLCERCWSSSIVIPVNDRAANVSRVYFRIIVRSTVHRNSARATREAAIVRATAGFGTTGRKVKEGTVLELSRAGMRQAGWEVVALLVEKETANFHRAPLLYVIWFSIAHAHHVSRRLSIHIILAEGRGKARSIIEAAATGEEALGHNTNIGPGFLSGVCIIMHLQCTSGTSKPTTWATM